MEEEIKTNDDAERFIGLNDTDVIDSLIENGWVLSCTFYGSRHILTNTESDKAITIFIEQKNGCSNHTVRGVSVIDRDVSKTKIVLRY
jgi:predicted RNA binding protein YcfA (HicA-like mRNA interferase family)